MNVEPDHHLSEKEMSFAKPSFLASVKRKLWILASKFSEVDERNTSCLSKTEYFLPKKTFLTLLEDMV